YVAAVDQGTTGTRCILFDLAGCPAASAYREHRQIFPRPGWVEHDPIEIIERVGEVVTEAMRDAPSGRVLSIGITNQRETIVAWVIWNLTGGPRGGSHVTDPTNASRTLLCSLANLDWDPVLLDLFGASREALPTIRPSIAREPYGHTLASGPFGARIPVCG